MGPGGAAREGGPERLRDRLVSLRTFDFEVAGRAAVAVAVPLVVLVLAGRLDWAAYASFGAMTSLYGRNEPYRVRLRTVSVAAALMVGSVGLGLALAVAGATLPVFTLGLVLVITAGIIVASTAGLFPGTPIFVVFAYSVCAQLPTPGEEAWPRLLAAVAAAGFAWALSQSGWLLRRLAGPRTPELFKDLRRGSTTHPAAWRDPQVWLTILQNVVGALLAGGLAVAVGIGHPYWAVVSVIAVLPPPHAAHSVSRAVHRIIGTGLGVIVTGLVLLPGPPVAVLIAVIAIGQFGAEFLIGRHYGAALLFITPLALTVVHLTSPLPVHTLLIDRVAETTLGGGIALLIVLLVQAVRRRARIAAAAAPRTAGR